MNYPQQLFVCTIFFVARIYSCDMTCDLIFNRDLITVYFNPYVNYKFMNLRAYTETGLIPMLDKISTRFSRIEMPSVYDHHVMKEYGDHASIALIPLAIANFNKNLSLAKRQSDPSNPKIIHLTTTFHVESEYEDSSFDIVKKLSDKSNSLFPGTVQSISFWCPIIKKRNFDTIEEHLKYAKNELSQNSSFPYQLGTNIDITVCDKSIYLERLFPLLDYVYFDILNKQENLQDDINTTISTYITLMETCKEKMRRLQPNLTVGFRLSWQDTDLYGKQNISNLVNFWNRMNLFVGSTNLSLILSEAFDVPYYGLPYNSQGWWRLHKNTTYKKSNEYVFEEKCSLISKGNFSTHQQSDLQGLHNWFVSETSKTNMKKLAIEYSENDSKSYWVDIGLCSVTMVTFIFMVFAIYKFTKNILLNRGANKPEEMVTFAKDEENMY